MNSKERRAKAIILGYASAHATVAFILANTVAGDAPILFILTSAMIIQLADLCGKQIGWQAAAVIAGNLFGAVAGGYLAAKLITWIPWAGNTLNASITFGITQIIGRAVFKMFNDDMTQEEAIKYSKSQKTVSQKEMDKIIESMNDYDKKRYKELTNMLKKTGLSDSDMQSIANELADLLEKYH
jgi:uncharacterized protein (DUF697 family)